MSLADDLDGAAFNYPHNRCTVCHILDEMEEGRDREALVSALHNPLVPISRIQAALTKAGYRMSEHPLYRHRKYHGPS